MSFLGDAHDLINREYLGKVAARRYAAMGAEFLEIDSLGRSSRLGVLIRSDISGGELLEISLDSDPLATFDIQGDDTQEALEIIAATINGKMSVVGRHFLGRFHPQWIDWGDGRWAIEREGFARLCLGERRVLKFPPYD